MTSPTKFYYGIEVILYMCSCDKSLVTAAFLGEKLPQPQFYKDLTRKTASMKGWSWFKFNNLGVALGENLKFYTSVAKGLKQKVRKFWGLILTFVEVVKKKTVRGAFLHRSSLPILNRVHKDLGLQILFHFRMYKYYLSV